MKAEELFIKIGNEFFNENLTVEELEKDPDFKFIGKAMREYARIQIEKDRERIKYLLTEHLSTHVSGNIPCCLNSINETPIILDL